MAHNIRKCVAAHSGPRSSGGGSRRCGPTRQILVQSFWSGARRSGGI